MKWLVVLMFVTAAVGATASDVLGPGSDWRQPCSEGFMEFDGYCYLASNNRTSWTQAQSFCNERGADLVKITSERENEFVLALARKFAPSERQVWIGLKWHSTDRLFYWSDHSVPVYTNWAEDEPNGKDREPCGMMWTGYTYNLDRASGHWNDLTCFASPVWPCGLVCKKLRVF